ncbi:MAG: fatty acid desaturase [Synechococcaceae cyanobacterium]|nr:fatty acid desaturase [Synechococcaceae cyanobacterium]
MGIGFAALLLPLWGITLMVPLLGSSPAAIETPAGMVALVLLRTFLHTGLFIVAHDALHRSLLPRRPLLNDAIGRLALLLYAFLPYERCRANHLLHHHRPGERQDPDFHDGRRRDPLRWYLRFLGGYLNPGQLCALLVVWCLLLLVVSGGNPLGGAARFGIVAILPLVLSSMQLFFFGTYLPHRQSGADAGPHRVGTSALPPWLSLLTCYHFGYHREHHLAPDVAWYGLPRLRRALSLDRINNSNPWEHAGNRGAELERAGAGGGTQGV